MTAGTQKLFIFKSAWWAFSSHCWIFLFNSQIIQVFPNSRHVSQCTCHSACPSLKNTFPSTGMVPAAMFIHLNKPCWNRDGRRTERRHPIGWPLSNQIPSSGNLYLDSSYWVHDLRDHILIDVNIFGPWEGQSAEKKWHRPTESGRD